MGQTYSNFMYGDDILVVYGPLVEEFSIGTTACGTDQAAQNFYFTSNLAAQGNQTYNPKFRVKSFNGTLQGQCVTDKEATDNEKKIKVLSIGDPTYTADPDSAFFLTQCWSDQGGPAPLNEGWAGSIASALVKGANGVSDLDKRAQKTLKKGPTPRDAGTLIFNCRPFAKEVMKRLYGITKTMPFTYQLESNIGIGAGISTTAEGKNSFKVSYRLKTSESNKTTIKCVKAVIIIYPDYDFDVTVENAATTAEIAAVINQFISASPSASSAAWTNAIDSWVDQMEKWASNQTPGPLPKPNLSPESLPGGGLFNVQITPQTDVAGAVFYVGAAFSVGTNNNGSLAVKFEGFKIQFSPNQFLYERELIKQLRARYREAMENYIRAVNERAEYYKQQVVPPEATPPLPPQDLLPPPDAIIVPPNGQPPSRENFTESGLPGADVSGATGSAGGVTIVNSGSSGKIIDSTVSSALVSD